MVLIGFLLVLATLTSVGVFATESVDRPRRRKERLAGQAAAN